MFMRRVAAALASGVLLTAFVARAAQTPAAKPATGLIAGQVIDAISRRPIPGAVVILSAPGGSTIAAGRGSIVDGAFALGLMGRRLSADPPQQVTADENGRFAFQ